MEMEKRGKFVIDEEPVQELPDLRPFDDRSDFEDVRQVIISQLNVFRRGK